ncbi:MAG TPA: alanine--tRNA ligase-related protein [Ktedonobacterales bacterium]
MRQLTREAWSSETIAREYLRFFTERDHLELPGSPLLVPGTTTSFVIAGMQPLMPFLRGQAAPPSQRLTAIQQCLRTVDIERVGGNARTLTSFFMLGNWSIGDYGRPEAIALALELLDHFGLDRSALWVTVFGGDADRGLGPDEAAAEEWRRAGLVSERIVPLGYDDNFWTTGGPGPGGPCTEMYVDRGAEMGCGRPECRPGCDCPRFLEVWNLVFVEFEQQPDGTYEHLPLRSVDTGMGLERFAAVAQGVETVCDVDLFQPALQRLNELAPLRGGMDEGERARADRARRIIMDHSRAALLASLAGVEPAPNGPGSVLRRLIRRAARQGAILGLRGLFLGELVPPLIEAHGSLLAADGGDLTARGRAVAEMLAREERGFSRVLSTGLRLLEREQPDERGVVPGERLFRLHAERGFPPDLAAEVLAERGLTVDWTGYEREVERHRTISRVSAERKFGGS